MTPPNKEDLLDRLKSTPSENLSHGIKAVDKLGEQDYEDAQRAGNHKISQNWNTVKCFLHWVVFAVGAVLIISAVAALLWLLWVYISEVIENPAQVKDLLSAVWHTLLVIGSTLLIEHKFGRPKK